MGRRCMSPNVSELQRLQEEVAEDVAKIAANYLFEKLMGHHVKEYKDYWTKRAAKEIFNRWANPPIDNMED